MKQKSPIVYAGKRSLVISDLQQGKAVYNIYEYQSTESNLKLAKKLARDIDKD